VQVQSFQIVRIAWTLFEVVYCEAKTSYLYIALANMLSLIAIEGKRF
jgi:hypothetical protein